MWWALIEEIALHALVKRRLLVVLYKDIWAAALQEVLGSQPKFLL